MSTIKQKIVIGKMLGNKGMSVYKAMTEAGYSPAYARNSQDLIKSKSFQELLDEALDDTELLATHKELLRAKRLDHMIFPLETQPKETDDELMRRQKLLTDADIIGLLEGIGGTVKRIVHGEQARHVYFWVANDKARQDALKLAYDIKGRMKVTEPPARGDTYNMFLQSNQTDPNVPAARKLVDSTLRVLMDETKRITDAPKPAP